VSVAGVVAAIAFRRSRLNLMQGIGQIPLPCPRQIARVLVGESLIVLLAPSAPRLGSALPAPIYRPASGTRLYRPLNQLVGLGHDADAPTRATTDPSHPRLIRNRLPLPEHDIGQISRFPPRAWLAGLGLASGLGGLERSAFAAAREDGFGGAGAQPVASHALLVATRQTQDFNPPSTVKVLKVVTPISFNLHDPYQIDLHPRRQLLLALLPLFGLFIWMDGAKGVWGGGGAVVEGEASAGHNLITYHSMQNSTTPKNGLPCVEISPASAISCRP